MHGFGIEGRYKHDTTFHRIVDQLRALLSAYYVTPGELREAAVLASTMHEAETIRPIYISMDEAKDIQAMDYQMLSRYYPYAKWHSSPNWVTYGIQFEKCVAPAKPVECDCTKDLGKDAPPVFKCICGCTSNNKDLHMSTCNDYNWAYYHPKVEAQTGRFSSTEPNFTEQEKKFGTIDPYTEHVFSRAKKGGDRICVCCNLSYVYVKFSNTKTCLASSPTKS